VVAEPVYVFDQHNLAALEASGADFEGGCSSISLVFSAGRRGFRSVHLDAITQRANNPAPATLNTSHIDKRGQDDCVALSGIYERVNSSNRKGSPVGLVR
jgi:hypothetical protein